MPDRRLLTLAAAIVFIGIAVALAIVRPASDRGELPRDFRSLALRLAEHPTDWRAASALCGVALDQRMATRIDVWRSAHAVAAELAPTRPEPQAAFARAALFHWEELSDGDRRAALAAYAPELRTGAFFRMAAPLFALTGNLDVLRRNHPDSDEAVGWLANIAATNGRFADYRELRDEVTRRRIAEFRAHAGALSANEIVAALPPPPYHADLQPLLVAALNELSAKPLSENPSRPDVTQALTDYALRHNLKPLDGLEAITRLKETASDATRARLARKLGLVDRAQQIEAAMFRELQPAAAWNGSCDDNVCTRAWRDVELAQPPLVVRVERAESDEVPPYVEVYVDDARVGEGEVAKAREFTVAATPGTHRVEVDVANPDTRNRCRRRVRISAGPAR